MMVGAALWLLPSALSTQTLCSHQVHHWRVTGSGVTCDRHTRDLTVLS